MKQRAEELFYKHAITNLAKFFHQELRIVPNRDYFFRHAHSGPRILTLAIGINPQFVPRLKSLQEQLAYVVALEAEQHIRLARGDRGLFYVEVPKPQELCYDLPLSSLPTGRGVKVPLGLDGFYRPIRMDFEDPLQAHTLIAGTTGSGKTNGLRLLLYHLVKQNGPDDVQLLLLDPSKSGRWFHDFDGLPHLLHSITTEQDEIAAVLAWILAERDRRSKAYTIHPRIFVALDEAHVVLEQGDFVPPVRRLVAEGREVGIHVILVTQKPNVEALGSGMIRDLLANRIVGCVRDPDEAYRATGRKGSGADLLTRAGDMLFILPGFCKRGQVPLITADVIKHLGEGTGIARNVLDLPTDKEIARALDGEHEEDGEGMAGDFSTKEIAIALIGARHSKGRPWLKDTLREEMGNAPGSGRASRLRDFGRQIRDELQLYTYDICRLTADR